MLEESARSSYETRIRPLTHVSVDRAYQAESVGSNSLLSILIAIRRSPIFMSENLVGKLSLSRSHERSASTSRSGFLAKIWSVHRHTITV